MTVKVIGIYKITSPNGKVYIGQSVNIKKRFTWYRSLQNSRQVKLFASFSKHGVNNHSFEIIQECQVSDLNNLERYWQDFYDCLGENGLNLRLTTADGKSGSITESHKQKIGAASKGRKFSSETRAKMSDGQKRKATEPGYLHPMKGRNHSEISKTKMGATRSGKYTGANSSRYGKPLPESVKQKLRLCNTGKKASTETRIKMAEAAKRRWAA